MTDQLPADTITLRDLYKKSHWQVAGPTFYQLHLLFDKHFQEQAELVDAVAERIQLLGGVSLAMAPDVAETTRIAVLLAAGRKCRCNCLDCLMHTKSLFATAVTSHLSRRGWATTGPMIRGVCQVLRGNELRMWFLSEHLVSMPLVEADGRRGKSA